MSKRCKGVTDIDSEALPAQRACINAFTCSVVNRSHITRRIERSLSSRLKLLTCYYSDNFSTFFAMMMRRYHTNCSLYSYFFGWLKIAWMELQTI